MGQKYALVTGTDHGVGLALAEGLLERGYYVVAARLNPTETQIDELRDNNKERMFVVELDIGSDQSVAAMKEKVAQIVPHIDLLINNAGILGDMSKVLGDELDFDEMLRVINVNALGTLRVSNALADLVLAGEDKTIVNISSEAGSIADCWREGWFGYCMSKAANNMQSALVHNNVRKHGGKVMVLHPGHVATYMRGHLDTTANLTPKESATGILRVVLDTEFEDSERPAYVNYRGDKLPW
ncbi:MAG: SDR family NAD(P)-dependent oxidoreductase [Lachnospiraceae bacterium]|nr:SDR family NAD(P)-dependent oxidoreductase [Lachnospiraceae bacterium]